MKIVTLRVPDNVYEWLEEQRKAEFRRTMTDIILSIIMKAQNIDAPKEETQ